MEANHVDVNKTAAGADSPLPEKKLRGILKTTSSVYSNTAFVSDVGQNGRMNHESYRGNAQGTRDGFGTSNVEQVTIMMGTAIRKSGRSYTAGGLLYGHGGYFQHPYGNRLNFLQELLREDTVQDKAPVPQSPQGKFAVWLLLCLFMIVMAVIIIFVAESSRDRKMTISTISPISSTSHNMTVSMTPT